jgi:hypothetical protein
MKLELVYKDFGWNFSMKILIKIEFKLFLMEKENPNSNEFYRNIEKQLLGGRYLYEILPDTL